MPPIVDIPKWMRFTGEQVTHLAAGVDETVCGEFFQPRHVESHDRTNYLCLRCCPVNYSALKPASEGKG